MRVEELAGRGRREGLMRRTFTFMAALIALAVVADTSFAQYRHVHRPAVVTAQAAAANNPYLATRNYPLATPYSIWAQAAATQYNAQVNQAAFNATVWSMANQGNYNPYAYNPYAYNP